MSDPQSPPTRRDLSAGDVLRAMHAEIPASLALGVSVHSEERGLVLGIPVAGNQNGLGTFFAGSLNALATLAGWGALQRWVYEHGVGPCEIVLQDSTMSFDHPVRTSPRARPNSLDRGEAERLCRALNRGRAGRVRMDVSITAGEPQRTVARFSGRYVLRPARSPATG